MNYKYKNVSDVEQSLIGVGVVRAGGEVETDHVVENPNFKFVSEVESASIDAVQLPQDNAVTEAELIQPNTEEIA